MHARCTHGGHERGRLMMYPGWCTGTYTQGGVYPPWYPGSIPSSIPHTMGEKKAVCPTVSLTPWERGIERASLSTFNTGEKAGLCASLPTFLPKEAGLYAQSLLSPLGGWALCAEASLSLGGWALCADAFPFLRRLGSMRRGSSFLLRRPGSMRRGFSPPKEAGLYAQRSLS